MSAVTRKTLKTCCSVMPRWRDRLHPDDLINSAAWIPRRELDQFNLDPNGMLANFSTRKQKRTAMSNNTKLVRVQGLDFHVRDVGDKQPALVVLHSWDGTGRTWDLVIRELAAGHRCVAPDLRGGGGSDKKVDGYDLKNINVPITVIVGDVDKVETESLLRRELAPRISGTEFIVLPGVGHLSPLEAPRELAAVITKAVSKIR